MQDLSALEESAHAISSPSPFMADFFKETATIKEQLNQLKKGLKSFSDANAAALKAPSSAKSKEASEQIEQGMAGLDKFVQAIKSGLTELSKKIKSSKGNDAEKAIQNNICSALTAKFQEHIVQYTEIQTKLKTKKETAMTRQAKIINPDANDADLVGMIAGATGDFMFADALTQSTEHRAKDLLLDVKERHREIKQIENSITELKSVYVEMATLAANQREMVNEIDYKVQASLKYTEEGVDDLKQAQELQKSAQKKRMIMIGILVVVGLVIGVGVAKG